MYLKLMPRLENINSNKSMGPFKTLLVMVPSYVLHCFSLKEFHDFVMIIDTFYVVIQNKALIT